MGAFTHKTYISPVGYDITDEMKQKKKDIYINSLSNCVFSNETIESDEQNQYYSFTVIFDEENIENGSWQ